MQESKERDKKNENHSKTDSTSRQAMMKVKF